MGTRLIDKIRTFRQIIKQNGGWIQSYLQLYRTDELKLGTLVGTDKYGHKYYQNKMYFMGRSRWVQYPDSVGLDYDGSQIPAEWHRWLHYTTDETPEQVPPVQHKWIIDHKENFSGTDKAYVPYSTVRPKIKSWVPPQNAQK